MPQKPQAAKGETCPLYRKDVSKVCQACAWYIQVRGRNPNTGEDIDHWGCSMSFLPILAIENSQQQRQTASAIESFRNEVAKQSGLTRILAMAPIAPPQQLNGGAVRAIEHHDPDE